MKDVFSCHPHNTQWWSRDKIATIRSSIKKREEELTRRSHQAKVTAAPFSGS